MEKVVLGFSGGVDSAVAALLLLDAGYAVRAHFLEVGVLGAREDAERTAEALGIPLTVEDARGALESCVCAPFARGYLRGETLNPCLLCNPAVKFRLLLARADGIGAARIATGHYARAIDGGIYASLSGNDQSYQLCLLKGEQAARLLLPLGDMEKSAVRRLAEERGVPIARKPDSMDICFIPDHDYAGWIERRAAAPPPGDLIYEGKVIGRHEGIHRYTVGQRVGDLYGGRRLYVSEICPETNEIRLVKWEDSFRAEIAVRDMNWLYKPAEAPFRASVRARHTRWEQPACTVYPQGAGARVVADQPLRAPAKGQAAALYQGDRLLGGGIIV